MLITHRGLTLDLDMSDHISRQFLFSEFESGDMIHAFSRVKEEDFVVDVGANIGLWSCYATMFIGNSGRVFAYEPDRDLYVRLITNTSYIGYVKCMNYALSNYITVSGLFEKSKESFDKSKGRLLNKIGKIMDYPEEVDNVNVTTLDHEMENVMYIPHINLLKLDVEGEECKVLQGAEKCLRDRKIKNILVEVNHNNLKRAGNSVGELMNILENAGFGVHYRYEQLYRNIRTDSENPRINSNILFCLPD